MKFERGPMEGGVGDFSEHCVFYQYFCPYHFPKFTLFLFFWFFVNDCLFVSFLNFSAVYCSIARIFTDYPIQTGWGGGEGGPHGL